MNGISRTIAGPSGALHVEEWPAEPGAPDDAPPMLLVHGMVGHTGFWRPMMARRRPTRARVAALDLRGHGDSAPARDADYSVEGCADDVAAAMDALGFGRAVVVGHSYGAFVALEAAARDPARVPVLVLADPAGDFTTLPREVHDGQLAPMLAAMERDESWRAPIAEAFEQALAGGTDASREIIRGRLAATPRDRLLGMSRSMYAFPASARIDAYVARAERPPHAILAPANAWPFSLHALRPAIGTTVIADVGHWLQMDAPERFGDAVAAAAAPATGS